MKEHSGVLLAMAWITVGLMVWVANASIREHWKIWWRLPVFQKTIYLMLQSLLVLSWPMLLFGMIVVKVFGLQKKAEKLAEDIAKEIEQKSKE